MNHRSKSLGVQSHAKRAAHAEESHVRTASKIKKPLKGVVEDGLGYNMSKEEASISKMAPSAAILPGCIENQTSTGENRYMPHCEIWKFLPFFKAIFLEN